MQAGLVLAGSLVIATSCYGRVPIFGRNAPCVPGTSSVVPGGDGRCVPALPRMAATRNRVCALERDQIVCFRSRVRQAVVRHRDGTDWIAIAIAHGPEESSDSEHACAIDANRDLWCYGDGPRGELGLGDTLTASEPALVREGTSWTSVCTGIQNTCAVTADGALECWGAGIAPVFAGSGVPQQIGDGHDWISVSCTNSIVCVLSQFGEVRCFGPYFRGPEAEVRDSFDFEDPVPLGIVTQLATGFRHACAVTMDGEVWCWGERRLVGAGDTANEHDEVLPMRVPGLSVRGVSVGAVMTCAGSVGAPGVSCWGANFNGAGGPGPNELDSPSFTAMTTSPSDLAVGDGFTCIRRFRELGCFGTGQPLPIGGAEAPFGATASLDP